jgi:hypothetical protein
VLQTSQFFATHADQLDTDAPNDDSGQQPSPLPPPPLRAPLASVLAADASDDDGDDVDEAYVVVV